MAERQRLAREAVKKLVAAISGPTPSQTKKP
jgi:hypothetical protein